ncbi:hypothetical protein B0H16DRAFT_1459607 [Mycena metata]|uniref:Uncharacterized protein n=1 Tax=Mycena metata TaxID=1033252 RepID=A0AAD7IZB3_9AGAR|nr:hypothetical protein B0H16DRAFT_1459607 [Mycena metata]
MSLEFEKLVLGVNMAVVVLESTLYALLLVAASTTLYLRFSRHDLPKLVVCNPVILFTILISATSGAHWILTIVRFFDAFLWSANAERVYFNNPAEETQTVRTLLSITATLMGDAAIIHRLWLLWNRSLPVIVLPVLSCFGLLSDSSLVHLFAWSASTYLLGEPLAGIHPPLPAVGRWVEAGWAIILVQVMLICREVQPSDLVIETIFIAQSVLIVLLESAAVWTIWGLLFAVTSEIGSPLQIIMVDLSPVMVGLVNMAIYLRVELQCTRMQGSDRTGVVMTSSASIIPYYVHRASAQIPRGIA